MRGLEPTSEFWWRLDLSNPLPVVRRMAAMDLLLNPPPDKFADELSKIAERETDVETRDMLLRIVNGYKSHAGASPKTERTRDSNTATLLDDSLFDDSDNPAKRLEELVRLSSDQRRKMAQLVPDRLKNEKHPLVVSAFIRIFGRLWPDERLSELLNYVKSDEVAVSLAALDALRKRAPNLLKDVLPALLVSNNPRIRGSAVRALALIDLEEALAHIEALLLDADPSRRLEGFRCCFQVPFDKVMPSLLKAMAIETDLKRLAAYGSFFEINPHLEAPFKLYELSERLPAEHAELVRRLSAMSCAILGRVSLETEEFDRYKKRFQLWIERRAALRLAQEIVACAMEDVEPGEELLEKVKQAHNRTLLWNALQELATLPMPIKAHTLFQKLLSQESTSSNVVSEPTKPDQLSKPAATAMETSPGDFNKLLVCLNSSENSDETAEVAANILTDISKWAPVLVSAALRAAMRLSIDEHLVVARRLLSHADPDVAAAAIEYVDKFAPGELTPFIDRFIGSSAMPIKVAAFKALQKADPLRAVLTIETMLQNRQKAQQKIAIGLMIHIEFALLRESLAALLPKFSDPEVLESALCLFQANADPENVYLLYKAERSSRADVANKIKLARLEIMKILAADGRLAADEKLVEVELAKRFDVEEKKLSTEAPAYAYRSLKKEILQDEGKFSKKVFAEESPWKSTAFFASLIVILIVSVAAFWSLPSRKTDVAQDPIAQPLEPSAPVGKDYQIRVVEGRISYDKSAAGTFCVESEDGALFFIPLSDYYSHPENGSSFKGVLALTKRVGDKTWEARRASALGLR